MTNQLTQAELEAFGNLSGLLEVKVAKNENEGFTYRTSGFIRTSQLAKFAQLIQQRQGEVVGYVTNDEIPEHRRANLLPGVEVPAGATLYSAPPSASQLVAQALEPLKTEQGVHAAMLRGDIAKISMLTCAHTHGEKAVTDYRSLIGQPVDPIPDATKMVAQALEKAATIVTLMLEPEVDSVEIAQAIRALKDQPVEPNDAATIADYEECLASHRALVRELDVALNGEDGAAKQASLCDVVAQVKHGNWKLVKVATLQDPVVRIAKVLELHELFQSKRLTPNTREGWRAALELYSEPVEQGGDELVKALERIVNLSASQFFTMSDMAEECQNIARQALANRRGGE